MPKYQGSGFCRNYRNIKKYLTKPFVNEEIPPSQFFIYKQSFKRFQRFWAIYMKMASSLEFEDLKKAVSKMRTNIVCQICENGPRPGKTRFFVVRIFIKYVPGALFMESRSSIWGLSHFGPVPFRALMTQFMPVPFRALPKSFLLI